MKGLTLITATPKMSEPAVPDAPRTAPAVPVQETRIIEHPPKISDPNPPPKPPPVPTREDFAEQQRKEKIRLEEEKLDLAKEKVELVGAIISSPVIVRNADADVSNDEDEVKVELKKNLVIYSRYIPYSKERDFMSEYNAIFRKDDHNHALEEVARRHARENDARQKLGGAFMSFIRTYDAPTALDCLWYAKNITYSVVDIEHKDVTRVLVETDASNQVLDKFKAGVNANKDSSARILRQLEETNAINITQIKQHQEQAKDQNKDTIQKDANILNKNVKTKLDTVRAKYEEMAQNFLQEIEELENSSDFVLPAVEVQEKVTIHKKQCTDKIFHFETFRLRFCSKQDLEELAAIDQHIRSKRMRKHQMREWRKDGVPESEQIYEVKGTYPPYDHQWTMYKTHMAEDVSADLSDMGTGKTYSVLMTIDSRIQSGDIERGRIMIICPSTVIPNWERQIKLHTPHLTSAVIKGRYLERVERMLKPDADILIANYESFSMQLKLDKNKETEVEIPFYDLAKTIDWSMVVLDECHKIKNVEAKRTSGVLKAFEDTKYKIIMSGTINANKVQDIYVPFYFLNQGKQFSSALEKPTSPGRYAMSTLYEYFGRNYLDNGATKETMRLLTAAMEEISVRFKKHECLDLPDKVYEVIPIEMERKQRELYRALENQIVTELKYYMESGGSVSAIGAFGKLAKLSEAANGWLYDRAGNAVKFPWNPKLKTLLETLESINSGERCKGCRLGSLQQRRTPYYTRVA